MGRNENAPVFARGGISENVVVFIQSPAHGAKAVMTVSKRIRNGEFL